MLWAHNIFTGTLWNIKVKGQISNFQLDAKDTSMHLINFPLVVYDTF